MSEPRECENAIENETAPDNASTASAQAGGSENRPLDESQQAADEIAAGKLQKSGEGDDIANVTGDSANEPQEPLCLTFENHEAELIQAGTVVDEQGRSRNHRTFHILGVFLLLWMFVPNILKDLTDLMSWIMVAAAGGLLWMVTKYPAKINERFAKERAAASPECTVKVTNEGMTVIEGTASYEIDFGSKVIAYDYKDGITLHTENNRIVCIPKNQLSEEELFSLRAALRQGLGDRFNKIEPKPPQGLFTRPK